MSIGTVGQSAKLNFGEKDPQAEQNREDTHRMTNDRHLRIHADGTSESLEALQEMYRIPWRRRPSYGAFVPTGTSASKRCSSAAVE